MNPCVSWQPRASLTIDVVFRDCMHAISTWVGFPTYTVTSAHSRFSRTGRTPAKIGSAPRSFTTHPSQGCPTAAPPRGARYAKFY